MRTPQNLLIRPLLVRTIRLLNIRSLTQNQLEGRYGEREGQSRGGPGRDSQWTRERRPRPEDSAASRIAPHGEGGTSLDALFYGTFVATSYTTLSEYHS